MFYPPYLRFAIRQAYFEMMNENLQLGHFIQMLAATA